MAALLGVKEQTADNWPPFTPSLSPSPWVCTARTVQLRMELTPRHVPTKTAIANDLRGTHAHPPYLARMRSRPSPRLSTLSSLLQAEAVCRPNHHGSSRSPQLPHFEERHGPRRGMGPQTLRLLRDRPEGGLEVTQSALESRQGRISSQMSERAIPSLSPRIAARSVKVDVALATCL